MLTIIPGLTELPLLVQHKGAPVIRGWQLDGSDHPCPTCARSIILEGVVEGEVLDVAFKCAGCGSLSAAPSLLAGRGVGGVIFRVSRGVHTSWPMTTGPGGEGSEGTPTLSNDHDAIIVGAPALDRRALETGAPLPGNPPGGEKRIVATAAAIRAEVDKARSIFASIFPALERQAERSRRHGKTPQKRPHRLTELTLHLEHVAAEIDRGSMEVDMVALVELAAMSDLYQRWQHDPAYPRLLETAKDPAHFRHDLVLLKAAAMLSDAGLGAEIVVGGDIAAADLRIVVGLRREFSVEVKSPDLEGQPKPLDRRARRLIDNALDDAREQLMPGVPSVLLVGVPFWREEDLNHLRDAVADLWKRKGARRSHVTAGLVLSTTAVDRRRPETLQLPFDWSHVDFLPDVKGRWVANPHYDGDLRLSFPDGFLNEQFDLSFPSARRQATADVR